MTSNGRSSHSESVYVTSINLGFKGFAGSIKFDIEECFDNEHEIKCYARQLSLRAITGTQLSTILRD